MTNRYENRIHIRYHTIPCGGNLNYEKTVKEWFIVNFRILGVDPIYKTEEAIAQAERLLKAVGKVPHVRLVIKNLYRCDKCNDLVNIISPITAE